MEMIPDATALKIHFKFVLNVCLYHFFETKRLKNK